MKRTTRLARLLLCVLAFSLLTAAKKPKGDYEVIIVGSGFGGSIAAYNLALEGVHTLILERGRWWTVTNPSTTDTFATVPSVTAKPVGDGKSSWLSNTCRGNYYLTFLPEGYFQCNVTTGMMEIIGATDNPNDRSPAIRAEGVSTSAAAGVGGGSLLYNGVSYAPLKEAWDVAFPKKQLPYMQDVWNELQRCGTFNEVLGVIDATPPPEAFLQTPQYNGTRMMRDAAIAAGYPLENGTRGPKFHGSVVAPVAANWNAVQDEFNGTRAPSAIVGEAWWGLNSDAKHSLDKPDNYLGMAMATGKVEIRALSTVTNITYDKKTKLYKVDVMRTDLDYNELERFSLTTAHLIMSAGSMGTTKLMVRARDTGALPNLNEHVGTRWSSNGNTSSFRIITAPTDPLGQGGPAGMKIVNYDNAQNPIVFENLPQRVPAMFAGIQSLAPFLGAQLDIGLGIPTKLGNFTYEAATDTVVLHWPTDGAQNVYDGFVSMMNELKLGSNYLLAQPTAQGFTAHPLGGMPLGLATDLNCEVKGYKYLYAVDGSIVPGAAAATNPSILISALAQRCMNKIAKDIKHDL